MSLIPLGELESAVLEVLWSSPSGLPVRDVLALSLIHISEPTRPY